MMRRSSSRMGLALGLVLVASVGCGGSVKANAEAKAGTDGTLAEGDVNFDAQGSAWDTTEHTQAETDGAADGSTKGGPAPLLGARHDLLLGEGASATCQCLAVILGGPRHSGLVWTGDVPATNPATQQVIALGSEGVSCAQSGPGASYMGYKRRGPDVVVTVEAAVEGRPITHGAIIPQPLSGGKVLVVPNGSIPYGKGPSGEPECTVLPTP